MEYPFSVTNYSEQTDLELVQTSLKGQSTGSGDGMHFYLVKKGIYPMSTEKNKAVVHRLFEEIMQGNLAVADELITQDYAQHSVFGIQNGRDAFKQFFMAFAAAVPDAHFVIADVIAENDKVVTRMTVTGNASSGRSQGSA